MNKLSKLLAWRSWLNRENLLATAQKPRVKKTGITLLAAFLGICATLYFAGPPLLKSYLTDTLSQKLGRKVTVGAIHVNPLALSVTVDNFTLAEADGKTSFVAFRELYANAQLASLAFGGPVLREIRLTEPKLRLQRNLDETYNFQDLLEKFTPPPATPAQKPEKSKPLSFSLNNIQILGGQIDFDDRPQHKMHTVRNLRVVIPFLSDLFYRVDDYVQPEFSAVVNGARLDLSGQSKPFEKDRESSLELKLDRLQLGTYLSYVPKKLYFTLPSGALSTDLKIAFQQPQDQAPKLSISGTATLRDLALNEAKDVPTLKLKQLTVNLRSVEPLVKRFAIDSVAASDGELYVRRDRNGRLNLANLVEPDKTDEPLPWFEIKQATLDRVAVQVRDEAVPHPFETLLNVEHIGAQGIGSEKGHSGKIDFSATGPEGASLKANADLVLQPLGVQGSVTLAALPIKAFAPYYDQALALQISQGTLGLATRFNLAQAAEPSKDKNPELAVTLSELGVQVANLKARQVGDKNDLLQLGNLDIQGGALDLGKQRIALGEVALKNTQLNVVRDSAGKINLTQLVRASSSTPAKAPTKAGAAWQYEIAKIIVDGTALRLRDEALKTQTANIGLEHIQAHVEHLSSAPKSIANLSLNAQMGRSGRIALDGKFSPQPLTAKLQVNLKNVPILPAQPYFSDKVHITVTSGTLSARGKLDANLAAEPVVRYNGTAQINQFASVDQVNSNDFLKWDSLYFGGIQVVSAPLKLAIGEIALSNFYSRLIINPDGTLNVQHIVGGSAQAAAGETAAPATPQVEAAQAAPAVAAAPTTPAAVTPITIGRVVLQGGQVNFSDRFIKPNYSANLTNIGGRVSGLSSDLATTADVELRGQVDNTAPVEILGKVNPLSGNLFLDLAASAKGVDLPTATPYSARYAGYPIIKGKLSMDVKYRIENKKLSAENHIVLDQLTFGDKVESPDATKLPVLLAVALLRDRNGVIDINLPISGSLDDPKFSIGGIVVRVIINLIGKALTSPFALLGSLFPNSEQLSYIEFEDGQARLDAAAATKIQNLAQALEQRPALKLDITGRVDPQGDKEGLRRASIERKVKAVKFEILSKQGKAPVSLDEVKVEPAEYPKLLKEAYSREKFAKPRNVIGFAKDLPVPEMEKLMLTNAVIGDDDLRQLALRRARAVADALAKTGKVSADRVFVLEPKLSADPKDKLKNSRVDFSLK